MTYITEIEDEARQDLFMRHRVQNAILPPLELPTLTNENRIKLKDMFIAPYSRRMASNK
jgi:hypothetical protein